MGGTDDPSNLVELTVEEHAEAHRKLWERFGLQEDFLAWKGLSGQIPSKEIIRMAMKHGSLKRAEAAKGIPLSKKHKERISVAKKGKPRRLGTYERNRTKERNVELFSKNWKVIDPQGNIHDIFNLKAFCESRGINYGPLNQKKKWKGWKLHVN